MTANCEDIVLAEESQFFATRKPQAKNYENMELKLVTDANKQLTLGAAQCIYISMCARAIHHPLT
jgi:hypothetical protein